MSGPKNNKRAAFDDLAKEYDEEIPEHIRKHLCIKKVDFMVKELEGYKGARENYEIRGLDCGCGTGWHVKRFREKGFSVDGLDCSEEIIKFAEDHNSGNRATFMVSSVDKIHVDNESYDFLYFINALHHLKTLEKQKKSLDEAYRVLRPGGILFIQEINESFFLFRFYMKYIFPLTSKIDHGERKRRYIGIKEILEITGDNFGLGSIKYFTFLPNIVPAFMFQVMKKWESYLEEKTSNKFGAHWLLTLERKG